MEKISILVPCCNVERYVRECLESIKKQTYTNLEVICIDDGSKDNTGVIIDEFVANDNRFRVIHKPNSGYGDSMNKGLEACTGDYIGIVESDDWVEPDMFETLLYTAKGNDLDLVRCCWYEGPNGTERENHVDWVVKDEVYKPIDRESVFLQPPSIWVSLYRKDLLDCGRKIRFLPTPGASYQDTSFAFKCYSKAKRFMMLDKPYHHYRINPNSSVSSPGKVYCIIDEWEEMRRWICEDPELRKWFGKTNLMAKIWQGGLVWNYERLPQTVLQLLFLRRACQFFRHASADGILNFSSILLSSGEKVVKDVMEDPLSYHTSRVTTSLNILKGYEDFSVSNQEDLISVVVTCYNTSKYIYSSLMSILQQSYRNIEIICIDDCSTDDTKVIVHHLMRKNSCIQWYSTHRNSGLSASRNLAIEKCKGKYVIFVDGDDCLLPGAIARLYKARENDDDVVAGSIDVCYDGGEGLYGSLVESDKNYYRIKSEKKINVFRDFDDVYGVNVSACGKLWKLSVLRENKLRFPDGKLYEDACFYWKYLTVAHNIHVIKEPVYLYHRHIVGSIMSSTFEKKKGMAIQHILILDDIYEYAIDMGKRDEIRAIMKKLYEPYFWFAYNNSPISDYEDVLDNMCRILKEQKVDTSDAPLLDYISHYDIVSKGELYMSAYTGFRPVEVEVSPAVYRLNKKLKKYRKLTKFFVFLSIILLIILVFVLIVL